MVIETTFYLYGTKFISDYSVNGFGKNQKFAKSKIQN